MKLLVALVSVFVVGLLALPMLASGGESPALGCAAPTELQFVLATIRTIESGGNYTAQARGSSASGAYQFIDSTWGRYGGFLHAREAPPEVQDAKAAEMVTATLARHDDDVSAVPVVWYIGHVPAMGSVEWDAVPFPGAGNRLTPREYQARWIRTYRILASGNGAMEVDSGPPPCDPLH